MWKLAFRNIFRHPLRTALTLSAIVLGVVGLILSGGFVEDIFKQLREFTIHSRLGHIQIHHQGYESHGRHQPFRYAIEEPGPVAERLEQLPEVKDVLHRVRFNGLLNNGRTDRPIVGEGVQPAKEARLGTAVEILEGRRLGPNDAYGMLLGEGLASTLNLQPGDFATIVTNTARGALNVLDFRVVGVFRTMSKDYDARAVRIPLTAAQELLVSPVVHSLVLSLNDTEATRRVAQEVKGMLADDRFEVRRWDELAIFYNKTVALYKRQFGALQLVILVMVVLGVANSVNMTIYERFGECGTLRALGSRSADVWRLLMLEHAILGVVGAAMGVVMGLTLAWLVSAVGIPMPPPPNTNAGYTATIQPSLTGVITAALVGMIATVLAAVLPARRAARLPIAEGLRENV